MDDEETIYSTEIQLEIGELKVVEEEIVYTWGKFKSPFGYSHVDDIVMLVT